eukprot:scaffold339_cov402-Prasinococcus_capsulatus_cf.AAC.7
MGTVSTWQHLTRQEPTHATYCSSESSDPFHIPRAVDHHALSRVPVADEINKVLHLPGNLKHLSVEATL